MKISVITTTKSKTENILRLTKSINKIKKDIYEFIIVDAGTPKTQKIKSELYPTALYLDGKETNRSSGKNLGIRHATGDCIAFLDDDTKVTDDWAKEIKRSVEVNDIVAGYSPNPIGADLPRVPVYINGQDITWPTCNIAYKKKIFDTVGFFDEHMITAEDMDLNARCVKKGYAIGFNPHMIAFHYHRTSWKGFAKQAFWNGYGRKQFNQRHPELKKAHQHGANLKQLARLGFGAMGYIGGGLFKK
jgi:GT2 family glycosyltransferase